MVFLLPIIASSSMPPLLPSVDPSSDEDSEVPCGFEPKVAIVVGILAALLCVTFFLVLYGRHCKRVLSSRAAAVASSPATGNGNFSSTRHHHVQGGALRLPLDSHGTLSQWLVDALPKLQPSLKLQGVGVLGVDECPVCLSKYEGGDLLRLLPRCKHVFHVVCVDKWFASRASCPVCRTFVSCQDIVDLENYYLHHEEQPDCHHQERASPPPQELGPQIPSPAALVIDVALKAGNDELDDLSSSSSSSCFRPVKPGSQISSNLSTGGSHSGHSELAAMRRSASLDSSFRYSSFFSPKLKPSSSFAHRSI
ncbi:hypothetical protein SELMODRAFT_423895 [Selaginella moellendorffii]|uniref:RING-type domain-containing protein n=1 Tax=Selaginella moellendorffii TaxID=88036 RepID=D8SN54_SELML|nr:RING-H2 finger protein ATL43 [Selaginella moellendorffii]EFJ14004.1 hypothetical protein SELMODRAFT_423895 [Selaginella moellendorffii]|eukprot:XP_002984754.1 RING-H2 finger protein ATL43 [Selaginella moellendorffii]